MSNVLMTDSNCTETLRRMDAYVDNEIDTAGGAAIAAHIETCPSCREELELRRRLRSRLKKAVDSSPAAPYLQTKVLARVRASQPKATWLGMPRYFVCLGGDACRDGRRHGDRIPARTFAIHDENAGDLHREHLVAGCRNYASRPGRSRPLRSVPEIFESKRALAPANGIRPRPRIQGTASCRGAARTGWASEWCWAIAAGITAGNLCI